MSYLLSLHYAAGIWGFITLNVYYAKKNKITLKQMFNEVTSKPLFSVVYVLIIGSVSILLGFIMAICAILAIRQDKKDNFI